MRLLALPLTRARPGRPSLVYYLAHLPPKPTNKPETRINWLVKTATNKAVDTWTSWGKAPQSNWKVSYGSYLRDYLTEVDQAVLFVYY